jgi:hypothetical protein
LTVPATLSFKRLHDAIQASMGWKDCHLFEFKYGPYIIARKDEADLDGRSITEARQMTLKRLNVTQDDVFSYLYDFGDYWFHLIRVRSVSAEAVDRPHCVQGQGVCPPEDVGGVHGYAHLLDVMAHPNHEEHEELKAWADGWWDAGPFTIESVEERLAKNFAPRARPS